MARHHVFLVMGEVLIAMVLISALTGKCLVRYRGMVSRDENPKEFWQSIVVYSLLGLACFGLYLYTSN